VQAWFTEEAAVKKEFNSSLHSVTDFQLFYAITKGLKENFGWEEGFRRIELTLAHDILYKEPNNLVTFLDNHDLSRFYSMMGEDLASFKMGIALLYTLRGIPSIYYGTEILMKNFSDPDAKVREDFPGGWPGDASNKFTSAGRTRQEQEAFDFCSILGTWRKANTWFGNSKLMQFVPEENTYVYFRYDDKHTVMCVYNGNDKAHTLNLNRFKERLGNAKVGRDILSRRELDLSKELVIDPSHVLVIELPH
jgi:glycosidase